jgi:hypothetical protein
MQTGDTHTMHCERCNKSAPIFDENGQHNFCPASTEDGKIIYLCMSCKMEEIAEMRRKDRL